MDAVIEHSMRNILEGDDSDILIYFRKIVHLQNSVQSLT